MQCLWTAIAQRFAGRHSRAFKGGPGGETFGSAGAPENRFATPAVGPATPV